MLRSYIGGEWTDGTSRTVRRNPAAPDEIVAEVSQAGPAQAQAALEASAGAAASWRRLPAPARGAMLHRVADLLDARAEAIGRDLTREEGKTLAEGRRDEARGRDLPLLRRSDARARRRGVPEPLPLDPPLRAP